VILPTPRCQRRCKREGSGLRASAPASAWYRVVYAARTENTWSAQRAGRPSRNRRVEMRTCQLRARREKNRPRRYRECNLPKASAPTKP